MSKHNVLLFTTVVTVAALALMVIAFLTPYWLDLTSSDPSNPSTTNLTENTLGLRTFSFYSEKDDKAGQLISSDLFTGPLSPGDLTWTHKEDNKETIVTLTPNSSPSSTDIYNMFGTLLTGPVKARDAVLGTGIPAVVLGLVFLALIALQKLGKGPKILRYLAVLAAFASAVLVFLGVVVYSMILNAGYSLMLWTTFCLSVTLVAIYLAASDLHHTGGKARYVPVVVLIAGAAFGVAGLATDHWMDQYSYAEPVNGIFLTHYQYSGVMHYYWDDLQETSGGAILLRRVVQSTFSGDTFVFTRTTPISNTTQTLEKCTDTSQDCNFASSLEGGVLAPFKAGAKQVLICGVISLALGLIGGMGMTLLLAGKGHTKGKVIADLLLFASAAMAFLALFLFSAHTDMGYSYILYGLSGFFWVAAVCLSLLLANPAHVGEKVGLLGKH